MMQRFGGIVLRADVPVPGQSARAVPSVPIFSPDVPAKQNKTRLLHQCATYAPPRSCATRPSSQASLLAPRTSGHVFFSLRKQMDAFSSRFENKSGRSFFASKTSRAFFSRFGNNRGRSFFSRSKYEREHFFRKMSPPYFLPSPRVEKNERAETPEN